MRLFTYAALVLLAAASGCSSAESNPDNQLLSNDFDSLAGWGIESPSLTREQAHSGQYSIKIQKGIDYSLTYKNVLGRISPTRVNKITVQGYVYTTKPTNASLAVQLVRSETDGTNVYNEGVSLGRKAKKVGQWTKISQTFDLPAEASATNQLRIYMWGASDDEIVYLDDLQVLKE